MNLKLFFGKEHDAFFKAVIILTLLNGFFLQSYLIRFKIFAYPSNLQEVMVFVQAFCFFIYAIRKLDIFELFFKISQARFTFSLLFLALFSSVSFLLFEPSTQDFARYFKFVFFTVVYVIIFLQIFENETKRFYAIRIMGIGAVFFGLFSVLYNFLGFGVTDDFRLTGPLDSANYLASYLSPFLLFFLLSYLEQGKSRNDLILAVLSALLLMGTRSMAALFTVMIVIFCYYALRYDFGVLGRKHWGKLTVLLISMLFMFVVLFQTRVASNALSSSSSFLERIEIWRTARYILSDPLKLTFGLGLGQFQKFYEENVKMALFGKEPLDYKVLQPHNIVLSFWLQFGLLGAALIIYLITRLFLNFLYTDFKKFSYYQAYPFMLFYLVLHGLVDFPIFKNELLLVFGLTIELWYAKLDQDFGLNPKKKRVTFSFLVILGVGFFYLIINSAIILNPRFIPQFVNIALLKQKMLFYDVYSGHPRYEAIKYVTNLGKMDSFGDDTFRPDENMTRAEFLAIVLKSHDYANIEQHKGNCFRDVNNETIYGGAVCLARAQGFVRGDQNGTFRPDWRISKSEAFVILSKIEKWPIDDKSLLPYDHPNWYLPYVLYVRTNNLLEYEWDSFAMWHPINRGELAEIIMRSKK